MAIRFARRGLSRARAALFLLAALVVTAGEVRTADAAPADHKFISLRGRVADDAGTPLSDARVEVTGTREATALTGLDGRFQMTVP